MRNAEGMRELVSVIFLINEALRYNVKGRKYIGTDTKYYFEDMGVRNVVLGFSQVEETHAMENVLYNELRKRRYQVDVGQVDVWDKDAEGKTIKKQQEQASLLNINDAFKKVIIVGGYYIPHYNDDGVLITGLFDFLMDENGLEKV